MKKTKRHATTFHGAYAIHLLHRDPKSWKETTCNANWYWNVTTNRKKVTCKRCLLSMATGKA